MYNYFHNFVLIILFINVTAFASPEEDQKLFRDHFENRFPNTEFSDYKNGVYSIDASSREQWESIEDFPPYEINIEDGEALFNEPFKMETHTQVVLKTQVLQSGKIIHTLTTIQEKL